MCNRDRQERTGVGCRCAPLFGLIIYSMVLAGCSDRGGTDTEQVEVKTPSGDTLVVNLKKDVTAGTVAPMSVVTPEGETVRFRSGVASVGDDFVIASPEGQIEVHRKPRAIMSEFMGLPTPYLREDSLDVVVIRRTAAGDDPLKQGLLRPLTCDNPECSGPDHDGHPFLFTVRERSRIHPAVPHQPPKTANGRLTRCPACREVDYLHEYDLPETVARKQELVEELRRVRAARKAASKARPDRK